MKIEAFETTCLNCNNVFASPRLSDFSYGDAIFSCECGKEFISHTMISHPVTMIYELLCYISKIDKNNNLLRNFSANFADKSHFHQFNDRIICPECKSENLSVDENKKVGIWDIQTASYANLYSLSKEELFKKFKSYLLTLK
jgi:Zn finger protein HypA/HybF involved in hydrogenase expression